MALTVVIFNSFCVVASKVTGPTPQALDVSEHNLVTLTCIDDAYPPPKLVWKWFFNGSLKQADTIPRLTSTLVIASAAATDSGVYNCAAFDEVTGSRGVTGSAVLTVNSE